MKNIITCLVLILFLSFFKMIAQNYDSIKNVRVNEIKQKWEKFDPNWKKISNILLDKLIYVFDTANCNNNGLANNKNRYKVNKTSELTLRIVMLRGAEANLQDLVSFINSLGGTVIYKVIRSQERSAKIICRLQLSQVQTLAHNIYVGSIDEAEGPKRN
ncbi:MAG: hypothetical protein ABR936_17290 [Bacteroidota bacterium]